ncbi:MAG: hypothetical protein KDA58_11720 [Planctomycetaceae bacterium]|nr:hypothetical protein [Planctomycetaceae bacterium]
MSGDVPRLELDAVHDAVGPLIVYDDAVELTLQIGRHYHCHFDGSEGLLPEETTDCERLHIASELTADSVSRILTLRIGLAVYYQGDRCVGSALVDLDEEGGEGTDLFAAPWGKRAGAVRTERFLWNGPILDSTDVDE